MEYIIGILLWLLIGLILTRKFYHRYRVIVWSCWIGSGLSLLYNLAFFPYRLARIWGDLQGLFF